MALVQGTTTKPVAKAKPAKPEKPQRKATPIVTEHTRGQAHGGAAAPSRGGPADYGSSLPPIAHGATGLGHIPIAHAARSADALLRLLGSTDYVQPPARNQHMAQQQQESVLPADMALRLTAEQLKTDFQHPLRNPLNTGLDVASVASAGVGALARTAAAARAISAAGEGEKTAAALKALSTRALPSEALPARLLPDESGVRKVRLGGGHIQPRESQNILTAAAQHAVDRFSEAHPGAPVVGAAKRIERRLPKERAAAHARVTAEGIPFALAHKAVSAKTPGRVSAREVAANRLIDYGHEDPANAARLVEKELEFRHKRLALPDITPAERKAQTRLVKQLQAALPHVANPDAEVQALAREGAFLSQKSGALATAAGELKPETAAARLDLHPRIVAGAKYVEPTAARTGQETRALKNARSQVASLQRRHDEVLGKARAARAATNTKTPAEIAREDALDQHIADLKLQHRAVPKGSTAKLQARHAEIEKQWNALVDKYAGKGGRTTEQSQRNLAAKARRKKNAGVDPLQTVNAENRRRAELEVLQVLEHRADDPFVRRWRDRLAELNSIAEELTARSDRASRGVFAETPILHPDKPTTSAAILHEIRLRKAEQAALAARPSPVDPLTSPTLSRLGGALSVAKDRLKTAEAQAASRVRPTGLVGAEDVHAGPGAARVPDVAQQPRLSTLAGRKRGVTGKQQKLVQQSRGVLFTQGRGRADTRVILEDYLRAARHQTQAEDIKIAGKFSVPLDKTVGIPEGHVLYNPAGLKVPRALREDPQQLALEHMTPRQLSEHLIDERRKVHARVFPKTEAALPDGTKALRTIDKKLADAVSGDLSLPSTGAARTLARVFDTTNNVNKAALIYLKGSYVPLNFAGNVAFLALHQGPFLVRNLKRSSVTLSDLDPELLRRVDHEVGGGAAMALAHEAQGAGGHALRKIADVQGSLADTLPRRAAWIHEAAAQGFKTPDQIRSLLTMKEHRAVLNQVSESARRAMVDFGNLSANERKIVSRAIFIYPWMKGATVYAKDLALDRPIAADFAQHVRERIQKYQKQHLGRIDPNLTGLIPLNFLPKVLGGGGPVHRLGTTLERVSNPASLTPIGTASQVWEAAKGAVEGNAEQRALPISFANPVLNALTEAATHYNTFTGNAYPKSESALGIAKQDLVGTTDRPVIPALSVLKTALSKPQTTPFAGPASKQASFVKEGGLAAAAKQFFLGSARPRELNLPAAQARGRAAERASMSPTRRALTGVTDQYDKALATLRQKGVYKQKAWEPVYASAIQRIARRQAEYAKAGVKNQYDRLLVDLELAVRRGVMTKQMATADTAAFKGANDKAIENYRTTIHKQDAFGEAAASEVRKAYRDNTGGTWPPR